MARLTRRRFLAGGAVAVAAGLVVGRDRIRGVIRDDPARELPPKGDFPPPRRIRNCSAPVCAVLIGTSRNTRSTKPIDSAHRPIIQ